MGVTAPFPENTGGSGSSSGSVFIFQPGGTATENIYTSWSDLVAAVNSENGLRTIQMDDSFSSITIPAGTWDMTDVEWVGNFAIPSPPIIVTVSDGVTLPNLARISLLDIRYTGTTAPCIDYSNGVVNYLWLHQSTIRSLGTMPFLSVSVGGTALVLQLLTLSGLFTGSTPCIDLNGVGFMSLVLGEVGLAQIDTIAGTPGSFLLPIFRYSSGTLDAQSMFTGTTLPRTVDNKSENMSYDPTGSILTSTDAQAAFDEISGFLGPEGDIGALIDSTGGTVDGAVTTVVGSGADATINNNFADLAAKINLIRTALQNLGIMS